MSGNATGAKALLQARRALVVHDEAVSARKTRKGQARAKEEVAKVVQAEATNFNAWQYPVGLSADDARQVWAQPITFGDGSSFAKVVQARLNRERAGEGNLGLLGLSADDIAMLAVWRGYAEQVKAYLLSVDSSTHVADAGKVSEATGDRITCACFACEVEVALRDGRTDEQLLADADQFDTPRLSWEADYKSPATGEVIGRMRTRTPKAARVKARRLYETRLAFYDYIKESPLPLLYPETGQTFRNVHKEMRAGYKQFGNIVHGYTIDGMLSDDVSYVAYHRHDLVESGYDKAIARLDRSIGKGELFSIMGYTEADVLRNATFDMLYSKPNLLPIEADAVACIEMLARGYKFAEVLDAFEFTSASKLNRLIRTGHELINEAQASEEFATYRKQALAEMMTTAISDLIAE
jgi:hypothetical protein